jgi:hypothetical protein
MLPFQRSHAETWYGISSRCTGLPAARWPHARKAAQVAAVALKTGGLQRPTVDRDNINERFAFPLLR